MTLRSICKEVTLRSSDRCLYRAQCRHKSEAVITKIQKYLVEANMIHLKFSTDNVSLAETFNISPISLRKANASIPLHSVMLLRL